MLQSSMRKCIMIVTNPKLHHDWREDWAGKHMRRVGNNWRITLCMRYKKKACAEVLERMVLHGIVNLVALIVYRQKRTLQEGIYSRKWNSLHSRTILEVQCCQFNTSIVSSICHQKDTQEGRHRTVKELDRT